MFSTNFIKRTELQYVKTKRGYAEKLVETLNEVNEILSIYTITVTERKKMRDNLSRSIDYTHSSILKTFIHTDPINTDGSYKLFDHIREFYATEDSTVFDKAGLLYIPEFLFAFLSKFEVANKKTIKAMQLLNLFFDLSYKLTNSFTTQTANYISQFIKCEHTNPKSNYYIILYQEIAKMMRNIMTKEPRATTIVSNSILSIYGCFIKFEEQQNRTKASMTLLEIVLDFCPAAINFYAKEFNNFIFLSISSKNAELREMSGNVLKKQLAHLKTRSNFADIPRIKLLQNKAYIFMESNDENAILGGAELIKVFGKYIKHGINIDAKRVIKSLSPKSLGPSNFRKTVFDLMPFLFYFYPQGSNVYLYDIFFEHFKKEIASKNGSKHAFEVARQFIGLNYERGTDQCIKLIRHFDTDVLIGGGNLSHMEVKALFMAEFCSKKQIKDKLDKEFLTALISYFYIEIFNYPNICLRALENLIDNRVKLECLVLDVLNVSLTKNSNLLHILKNYSEFYFKNSELAYHVCFALLNKYEDFSDEIKDMFLHLTLKNMFAIKSEMKLTQIHERLFSILYYEPESKKEIVLRSISQINKTHCLDTTTINFLINCSASTNYKLKKYAFKIIKKTKGPSGILNWEILARTQLKKYSSLHDRWNLLKVLFHCKYEFTSYQRLDIIREFIKDINMFECDEWTLSLVKMILNSMSSKNERALLREPIKIAIIKSILRVQFENVSLGFHIGTAKALLSYSKYYYKDLILKNSYPIFFIVYVNCFTKTTDNRVLNIYVKVLRNIGCLSIKSYKQMVLLKPITTHNVIRKLKIDEISQRTYKKIKQQKLTYVKEKLNESKQQEHTTFSYRDTHFIFVNVLHMLINTLSPNTTNTVINEDIVNKILIMLSKGTSHKLKESVFLTFLEKILQIVKNSTQTCSDSFMSKSLDTIFYFTKESESISIETISYLQELFLMFIEKSEFVMNINKIIEQIILKYSDTEYLPFFNKLYLACLNKFMNIVGNIEEFAEEQKTHAVDINDILETYMSFFITLYNSSNEADYQITKLINQIKNSEYFSNKTIRKNTQELLDCLTKNIGISPDDCLSNQLVDRTSFSKQSVTINQSNKASCMNAHSLIKPRPRKLTLSRLFNKPILRPDIIAEESLTLQSRSTDNDNNKINDINDKIMTQKTFKSLNVGNCMTSEDWNLWIYYLASKLLNLSSSFYLKECQALLDAYPESAIEMFLTALEISWPSLPTLFRLGLFNYISKCLTSKSIIKKIYDILIEVPFILLKNEYYTMLNLEQVANSCIQRGYIDEAYQYYQILYGLFPERETVQLSLIKLSKSNGFKNKLIKESRCVSAEHKYPGLINLQNIKTHARNGEWQKILDIEYLDFDNSNYNENFSKLLSYYVQAALMLKNISLLKTLLTKMQNKFCIKIVSFYISMVEGDREKAEDVLVYLEADILNILKGTFPKQFVQAHKKLSSIIMVNFARLSFDIAHATTDLSKEKAVLGLYKLIRRTECHSVSLELTVEMTKENINNRRYVHLIHDLESLAIRSLMRNRMYTRAMTRVENHLRVTKKEIHAGSESLFSKSPTPKLLLQVARLMNKSGNTKSCLNILNYLVENFHGYYEDTHESDLTLSRYYRAKVSFNCIKKCPDVETINSLKHKIEQDCMFVINSNHKSDKIKLFLANFITYISKKEPIWNIPSVKSKDANEQDYVNPNNIKEEFILKTFRYLIEYSNVKANHKLTAYRIVDLIALHYEHVQDKDQVDNIVMRASVGCMYLAKTYLLALFFVDSPCYLLIRKILMKTLKWNPQSLVYDLLLLTKYKKETKVNMQYAEAANSLLRYLNIEHSGIVEDLFVFYEGLEKIVIFRFEYWYLELSNILGFCKKGAYKEAFQRSVALLNTEEKKLCLVDFETVVKTKPSIDKAKDSARKFIQTGDLCYRIEMFNNLFKVYSIYKGAVQRLNEIELAFQYPELCKRSFNLIMPGTNLEDNIKIKRILTSVDVIASKQRPRKIYILGTDDKEYRFLLKGKEDLRQDQRIMEIITTCKNLAFEKSSENMLIYTYSITPLSEEFGLVSWLPNHMTLHELIRENRRSTMGSESAESAESAYLKEFGVGFHDMRLRQRMETLQCILERFPSDDVKTTMEKSSLSITDFNFKQTNYTISLAFISVVGYLLGLGDRHPSNIMIERDTFSVTNIDFGDCFDEASNREMYPEVVPFRLTKMLVKGLGHIGIEGPFIDSLIDILQSLRENKEYLSLMIKVFRIDSALDSSSEVDKQWQNEMKFQRVSDRLHGNDFHRKEMSYEDQAREMIKQATSIHNLANSYIGWCPFF
eukprot:GAHX01002024.1.p1 GENE.GAHX01002024.1~~GAHX01002024.1.p1  ORF type:complete len:2318 (-),score=351.86 GAHX01002024.1:43-6996(-)